MSVWHTVRHWLGLFDQPRHCKDCGLETERPVRCFWCDQEVGGGA